MTTTPASFVINGITFCYTTQFELLWAAGLPILGLPGDHPGSFWKPIPPTAFACFGSLCANKTTVDFNGNGYDPNGIEIVLCAQIPSGTEANPPLAYPTGFDMVWNDKDTGYRAGNGACWTMTPPQGYVALGAVFNNTPSNAGQSYETPNAQDYLCVSADLVSQIGSSAQIWDDRGTGAVYGDLACYAVQLPPASGCPQLTEGQLALAPNSFVVNTTYNQPIIPTPVMILPATVLTPDGPPPPPDLSGATTSTASAMGYCIEVPFVAVADNDRSLDWKLANPVYQIQRLYNYTAITSLSNASSVADQMTYSASVGCSQTNATSFQASLSATLGVGFSVGLIDEVKISLSVSAGFQGTWTSTSSSTTQQTVTSTVGVPAQTQATLWQYNTQILVQRADNTYVGNGNGSLNVASNDFYNQTTSLSGTAESLSHMGAAAG